ncbi:HMG2-induced ER-remodeling protein 1 [Trichomonascus vanleenenianus]|uniref:HMG2-induced ER-remodeling protein 1 n=1 Tax=Trichomonascus vanleenenianus TaxID=2268995 RepID=UPI003ECB3391
MEPTQAQKIPIKGCGVANTDVDWLARGNSLSYRDKASEIRQKNRARSLSMPQKPNLVKGQAIKEESPQPARRSSTFGAQDTAATKKRVSKEKEDAFSRSLPGGATLNNYNFLDSHVTTSEGNGRRPSTPPSKLSGWFHSFSSKFHSVPVTNSSITSSSTIAAGATTAVPTRPTSSGYKQTPTSRLSESLRRTQSETPTTNDGLEPALSPDPPRTASPKINTEFYMPKSELSPKYSGSLMHKLRRLSTSSKASPLAVNNNASMVTSDDVKQKRVVVSDPADGSVNSLDPSNMHSQPPSSDTAAAVASDNASSSSVSSAKPSSVDSGTTATTAGHHLQEEVEEHQSVLDEDCDFSSALPKRVSFAKEVLRTDPPQQIPSRNPKPGNICVGANGEITRARPPLTAPIGCATSTAAHNPHYFLPKHYATSAQLASQNAYEAAIRIANAVRHGGGGSERQGTSVGGMLKSKFLGHQGAVDMALDPEDVDVETFGLSTSPTIDTPMHKMHEGDGADVNESPPEPTLEEIYTRCCHLREILPIPATLKQLKGKDAPLDMIRLVNPKPTMIEILSFGDFLSVVPIHVVVLDNVTVSVEMLRVILSNLRNSTFLYKLSLKNVLMEEEESWNALCAFLAVNSSLIRLDLSIQIDSKRAKIKPGTSRAMANWENLGKAIIARGGIQELLLNGCMIPSDRLHELLKGPCSIGTRRLGLALNGLEEDDIVSIGGWMDKMGMDCEGVDLGGNDLGKCWDRVIDILDSTHIMQLSFNNTALSSVETATRLLKTLIKDERLRFIDISSNPAIFPGIVPILAETLPKLKDLKRIHLESNDLGPDEVVQLSEAFHKCPHLIHISLLHNRRINSTACAAIATAVDISSSIYAVEIDSDLVIPAIQRRLTHYCLVNMERQVAGKLKEHEGELKEFDNEKNDLVETACELSKAVAEILASNKDCSQINCTLVAQTMIKRCRTVREWIHEALTDLFRKKKTEGLNTESKEKLIRLVYMDGKLEKVLNWYDHNVEKGGASSSGDLSLPTPHFSEHLNGIVQSVYGGGAVDNPLHPDLQVEPMADTLARRPSSTSLHAKAQEVEEGELHKFGTFITSHPDSEDVRAQIRARPSGEQLRRAILNAKGNDTVSTLIDNIKSTHGAEIDKVLGSLDSYMEDDKPADGSELKKTSSNETIDDETLDLVVNDLARVLSHD